MFKGRDELVDFVLAIPDELAEFKGNREKLLMKPIGKIGIQINGIYYEDLKSLQILENEVKVYHGQNMIEVTFNEVNEIDFK